MVRVLRIDAPGTRYGPCPQPCLHRCCLLDRARALAPCSLCQQEIGYEATHLVVGPFQEVAHLHCLERQTVHGLPTEHPCQGLVSP